MRSGLTIALLMAGILAGACHDSPTEPPPVPTPTATPSPTPAPAGVYGITELRGSHGELIGPAPGVTVTVVQGAVTLHATSGPDASFRILMGVGLTAPGYSNVYSTSSGNCSGWIGAHVYLQPGDNYLRVGLGCPGPP